MFNIKHNIISKKAEELGINNFPGVDQDKDPCLTYDFIINNLNLLHLNCIAPMLREFPPGDLLIKSAYRSSILNEAITGKANDFSSQHVRGYAIDIVSQGYSSSTVWNWCYQNLPNYHQLIWEYPELGEFSNNFDPCSWVHISYVENNNIRTSSFSSKRLDLHEMYKSENTNKRGNMTHNISLADNRII